MHVKANLDRIEKIATRLWRVVTGGLMLAVTAISLAQVVSRYIFNFSLVWSEELNRLVYVWLLLIAAAGADHMRIGLLADRPRCFVPLGWLAVFIGAATLGFLVWGGWQLQAMFAFDRYTTLGLSKIWYFAAAIVGCAIWALALVWRGLRHDHGKQL